MVERPGLLTRFHIDMPLLLLLLALTAYGLAVLYSASGQNMEAVARQGLSVVGPPFGYYPKMPGDLAAVAAGFPVSAEVTPEGEVTSLVLPGGRALTVEHVGPYDTLEQTYGELATWVEKNGLATDDVMWESYLTDPDTEPPENWRTLITWPLR